MGLGERGRDHRVGKGTSRGRGKGNCSWDVLYEREKAASLLSGKGRESEDKKGVKIVCRELTMQLASLFL